MVSYKKRKTDTIVVNLSTGCSSRYVVSANKIPAGILKIFCSALIPGLNSAHCAFLPPSMAENFPWPVNQLANWISTVFVLPQKPAGFSPNLTSHGIPYYNVCCSQSGQQNNDFHYLSMNSTILAIVFADFFSSQLDILDYLEITKYSVANTIAILLLNCVTFEGCWGRFHTYVSMDFVNKSRDLIAASSKTTWKESIDHQENSHVCQWSA